MNIYPNAYYNYRKMRKTEYLKRKSEIMDMIKTIYHEHSGVVGYRMIKIYLERRGIHLSNLTVLRYMQQLGLKSIVRPKRPEYLRGKAHRVFPNLLEQDFSCEEINTKWVTDFTYLRLKNGDMRYNCTILDLHDRCVISSITDRSITAELAKRTLEKALLSQAEIKGVLILHSDQGSQYTSKEFVEYCESVNVTQSMSKAGYPYDNSPMERYFNTLKNELIYQHDYKSEQELYEAIESFAYVAYNHVRPHAYNNYRTPFEARYSA